jgi:hypothetical protein
MIAEMGINPGISVSAEQEYHGRHGRENSNRGKRIPDLADDVFILRKFLLYLKFEEFPFLPYI